jgi:DNA-binding NtrC family response regulator
MSVGLIALPVETKPVPTVNPVLRGVLIVDDEPAIRLLLERCCVLHGLQPFVAASGAEAVEIYRREADKIGVALLDVRMPGMSGPEAFEALQRLNPGVRCCFMSGDLGEYTAEELCRRGALHVFHKPLPLQELITVLQTLLATAADAR